MENKTLHAPFPAGRFDGDLPALGVDVEIPGHGLAVVADAVQRAAHIIDEHATRAGLIDQQHHARRLALQIRDGCKFHEIDVNGAFSRADRRGKRIVSRLGKCRDKVRGQGYRYR